MEKLLIAIDYDGTYTADPEAWAIVISVMKARGHEVIMCTHRHEALEPINMTTPGLNGVMVYYTGRKAKRPWLLRLGIIPDIWIDDNPHWINEDSR